ncbi:MAG: S-layer homology domain-containing protein [Clostridia bacterium]|nr:S-layer homology domain-containing protein [Clostridia bacterium]
MVKRKLIALLLSLSLCLSVFAPCVMAEEAVEYATREYIISEFVKSVGRSNLDESAAVLEMFTDSDKISDQYKEDVSRAVVGGIVKGYQDRTIRPSEKVSRLEAMVMLARCVPELEAEGEVIEFTDVPEWAKENIDYLSQAGLVKGYGDGTMGADDFITTEQVGLLVQRSDEALRTVAAGESFYGYVNEKLFRNASLENPTYIDPIHGAIVTHSDCWSHFDDVYNKIVTEETEILEKIVNGEVEYEKGSPEQRVHDMLECIDSTVAVNESDKKNVADMRNAILNAKNAEEFLKVTADIYKLAGINIAFDIDTDLDKETGITYPTFSIAGVGHGGIMAYRDKTDTKEYKDIYEELIALYLEEIGAEFTEKEIKDAIKLQVESSKDIDHFSEICAYLAFAQMFELIDEETLAAEIKAMAKKNPEHFDAKTGDYIGPFHMIESKDREDADATYKGFDVCDELTDYGFTNLEKIIVPTGKIAQAEKNLICDENLPALKINALLKLNENLGVSITKKEESLSNILGMFPFMLCLTNSAQEIRDGITSEEKENTSDEEAFAENAGVEFDEGILSAVNLNHLNQLLPNDVGLVYTKYYYDDEISYKVVEMIMNIGDAYLERFQNNTWMAEETKANAIKKLENMLAIVGYPDNYTFPEITPISEGGSLFSNTLSIKRHAVSELIRQNEDKGFIRTNMFMPPDEVNACYIPELNIMNIPAGILNPPFYDKNASYAANLGSIGMIIAHEIGHAFDKTGAMYDENGCLKNWWTEKDAAEFEKIQEEFVEYYNQFEVVDGVVQDANVTITENMADIAAMQIIMDIIGDDKQAQKECLEAYAHMWAQLGTVSYLTDRTLLSDVHASHVVRVNAVVATLDQFYEIYGIEEGDAMYIAPENRLKLW